MVCKRTIVMLCVSLITGSLGAMDTLPADIVRKIAKQVLHAPHWNDAERIFGLQSLALVNRRWNTAISGLSNTDFPYRYF